MYISDQLISECDRDRLVTMCPQFDLCKHELHKGYLFMLRYTGTAFTCLHCYTVQLSCVKWPPLNASICWLA